MNTPVKKLPEKQALEDQLKQSEYYQTEYRKLALEQTKKLNEFAQVTAILQNTLQEIIKRTNPAPEANIRDPWIQHSIQICNLAESAIEQASKILRW